MSSHRFCKPIRTSVWCLRGHKVSHIHLGQSATLLYQMIGSMKFSEYSLVTRKGRTPQLLRRCKIIHLITDAKDEETCPSLPNIGVFPYESLNVTVKVLKHS